VLASSGPSPSAASRTAAANAPVAAEPPRGRRALYVLDAPVPMGKLGDEEVELLKRFPFLGDPRLWPAVAAPRRLPLPAGVGADGEAYHEHGFLNHSCCPEVVRYFSRGALVLRATRPIQAGEEVSDSYFFPLVPWHLRSQACEPFGFRCGCPRCVREAALPKQMQVWAELTWANTVRILGEVAVVRATARGDPEALKSSSRAWAGLDQLLGLVESTEQRLRDLDLPEADLDWCLASWACPAAALGDLLAAVRGDLLAASEALGRAARWAEPVAPGHALGLLARSTGYAVAAGGGGLGDEAAGRLLALHRRLFGADLVPGDVLPGLLLHEAGGGVGTGARGS